MKSSGIDSFIKAIKEDTKVIFIESITNPNATILDIEGIAAVAHKHGIPLIVQAAADIHAETIRLSLGLEDPQDLIQDLVQAFEASAK